METSDQQKQQLIREIAYPVFRSKSWIKFLGILLILQGVLAAATLVGLLIAWLPIWVGLILYQSAKSIEKAEELGTQQDLEEALRQISRYFTIQGIFTLLGILLGSFLFILALIYGLWASVSDQFVFN